MPDAAVKMILLPRFIPSFLPPVRPTWTVDDFFSASERPNAR